MSAVKEYAAWVNLMLTLPESKREQWVKTILDGLAALPGREAAEIHKALSECEEFDRIGFSVNAQYVKDEIKNGDDEDDMGSVFIHAWGSPKLMYKHKKLPVIIIVGADLQLDKSVLSEDNRNKITQVRGITG